MTSADVKALAVKLTKLKKPLMAAVATWAATQLDSDTDTITQLTQQVTDQQAMIDQLNTALAAASTTVTGLQTQVGQLQTAVTDYKAAFDQQTTALANYDTATKAAADQVNQLSASVAALRQTVKDLQTQVTA